MDRKYTTWTFLGIGISIVTVGVCGYLGFFKAEDPTQLVSNAGPGWTSPNVVINEFRPELRITGYQRLPKELEHPRIEERIRIDQAELIDAAQMQKYRSEKLRARSLLSR